VVEGESAYESPPRGFFPADDAGTRYGSDFIRRKAWWTVFAGSAGCTGEDHVAATRGSDGSYAWVYLPIGGAVDIDLAKLAGPQVTASWYGPRDGSTKPIGRYPSSRTASFDAPGPTAPGNDWVLVLVSGKP
jgi:hypothetical protein